MPILLLVLILGVFAYFWWRHSRTTLTRACRWREDRAAECWRCVACGAEVAHQDEAPTICLKDQT